MSLNRSVNRNQVKNALKSNSVNTLTRSAGLTAEIMAKEMASEALKASLQYIALAIEGTFSEEYGFRQKRLLKLTQQLNERLPEYLQFSDAPKRKKIDKDKLYDVVELLLQLGCDEKCKITKNHNNCNMYKIFKSKDIEPYENEKCKCPYQVIPSKLTADEINCLKMVIKAKLREVGKDESK